MAITLTTRLSAGYAGGPTQTATSASFTPTANSKLYVLVFAVSTGGAVDIAHSSNTGGLTFTRLAQSANSGGGNGARLAIFEAEVGASPSAMTVTFDTDSTGASLAYTWIGAFDATGSGVQVKSGQIVTSSGDGGGGSSFSIASGTLPAAATSGNTSVFIVGRNNDGNGSAAVPSGWTALFNPNDIYVSGVCFHHATFTGTSATVTDVGQQVYGVGTVLLELEEATTPPVEGQASGSFGFTATAQGIDRVLGVGAASFGGTYAAQGRARTLGQATSSFGGTYTATGTTATPPVEGVAAGSFGGIFTAAGVDRALGVAAGSFGFAGSSSGQAGGSGSASALFGFTATALGVDRALGVAAAAFGFTGSSTGDVAHDGQAAGSFGFVAAAAGFSGTPPVQGQAAAAFGFVASAAGVHVVVGVAAGSFGGSLTAVGVVVTIAAGQASGSFGGSFAAAGVDRALGQASGSFGYVGAAIVFRAGTPAYRGLSVPAESRGLSVPAESRVDRVPSTHQGSVSRGLYA